MPKVPACEAPASVRNREFPRLNWHSSCGAGQRVPVFPDLLDVAQNEKGRLNTFKPVFQRMAPLCGLKLLAQSIQHLVVTHRRGQEPGLAAV
jgi:hypothetical protein